MMTYEMTPCPNHFLVKERYGERIHESEKDIYQTTNDDNEISMSWEDRRFL